MEGESLCVCVCVGVGGCGRGGGLEGEELGVVGEEVEEFELVGVNEVHGVVEEDGGEEGLFL